MIDCIATYYLAIWNIGMWMIECIAASYLAYIGMLACEWWIAIRCCNHVDANIMDIFVYIVMVIFLANVIVAE